MDRDYRKSFEVSRHPARLRPWHVVASCALTAFLLFAGACSEERPAPATSGEAASAPEAAPETDPIEALRDAARHGRVDEVRSLLAADPPTDGAFSPATIALFSAAAGRQEEIARLALESGADVNARGNYGWSPAFLILDRPDKPGAVEVAHVLLDFDADVASGEGADKFLLKVVQEREWELGERLLDHGVLAADFADRERLRQAVEEEDRELLLAILGPRHRDGPAESLCLAIKRDDIELVRYLIDQGLQNERCYKSLPVIQAVESDRLVALEILLGQQVEVDRVAKNGKTALIEAASQNRLEAAELLIAHGAQVDLGGVGPGSASPGTIEGTALIMAVAGEHFEMVDLLLSAGADVNLATEEGSSALTVANGRRDHRMVEHLTTAAGARYEDITGENLQRLMRQNVCYSGLLGRMLEAGADPTLTDKNGTPLLVAAAGCPNGLQSVRRLLTAGVDVDGRDATGRTPLMMAASRSNTDVAEYLLDQGADLELFDDRGWTALTEAATERAGTDTARLLLSRGADIDHRDGEGATPIMLAAGMANWELIAFLAKARARLDLRDRAGHTAAVYYRQYWSQRPAVRELETEDGVLRFHNHWFHGCSVVERVTSERKLASCYQERQYAHVELLIFRAPPGADPSAYLTGLHPEAELFYLDKPEEAGGWQAARMPVPLHSGELAFATLVSVRDRTFRVEVRSSEDRATEWQWILASVAQDIERLSRPD